MRKNVSTMSNPTTTQAQPIVQPHDEAATKSAFGGSIEVRLRSEQTGGRLGLTEQVVPEGYPGPPLHVHPDFEETFYVIEGTLDFTIGDHAHQAGPGTVAFVPRGTPHTFANTSQAPARSLVLVTPGGFERYFEELMDLVVRSGRLPADSDLRDLGIAYGSIPA